MYSDPTTSMHATPTAHVAIVPAYELSETALKLSRVIERNAERKSALRASGLIRVEQNFPVFRRMSSRLRSSLGHNSIRSKRSTTAIVPTPEHAQLDAKSIPPGLFSGPLQPIRSASPSPAPSPRASVKRVESSFRGSQAGDGPEEPLTISGRVWEFFDDPQSSPAAYYFSVSLFFFITLSTMVFIAQTDRSLERHRQTLNIMETICAGVFTIEYSLRALSAPSKWNFIKNFGNWVDLAAILPFYLEVILAVENAGSFGAIRIVRLTRVARVLKMSRYSSAIQVFVQAIAISIKALSMLVFLMAIAVVVFSSAIYFAEYTPDGCRAGGWIGECDGTNIVQYAGSLGTAAAAGARAAALNSGVCVCVDPNPYSSIAESFWWSIVTMSTVGYGDMTPVTVPGRIVGIATILTGMLVLALPITVIGTNFQKVMKSVMQQTMKSNVDYLKGKKQICREEIQAILQRFHAVTTDIHLNIDDIIQVYDTDNSGTLEDEELARFRHDLEMLQNRAFMNQHMDMQTPTPALAIPVPAGRTSPGKTMGALMRKLSSRTDIFQRANAPSPPTSAPSVQQPHPEHTTRQTIAVTQHVAPSNIPVIPVMRPSLSQPNDIAKTVPPMTIAEHPDTVQSYPGKPAKIDDVRESGRLHAATDARVGTAKPSEAQMIVGSQHHPLGVESDVLTEASLMLQRRASGPSIDQLLHKGNEVVSIVPSPSSQKLSDAQDEDDDESESGVDERRTNHNRHDHEHRSKHSHHDHEHHTPRDTLHHRSSRNGHHRHRDKDTEDVILQRLAEMQRAFEGRLLESEARLESKILNLTKILMRVEKLIELND